MSRTTIALVFAAIFVASPVVYPDSDKLSSPCKSPPSDGTSEPVKVRQASRTADTIPATVPDSPLGRMIASHKVHIDKLNEAARTLVKAHAMLDRGEYDQAISLHKAAKVLEDEAAKLKREFDLQIGTAIQEYLKALDSDDFKTRESATNRLIQLGVFAIPAISKARENASPEAQMRIDMVISRMSGTAIDEKGLLHQWADEALASSEYEDSDWSASQATGKPDTHEGGDKTTAWASKTADDSQEWLELTYRQAVRPVKIRIRETFNPGAVIKVECKDDQGKWQTIWEGKDTVKDAPGYLEVGPKSPITWPCKAIKITLDSQGVAGWNEIDAVELIGEPAESISATQPKPAEKSSPENRNN